MKSIQGTFRNRSMAVRASLALAIAASLSMVSLAPQQAQARVDVGISVNLAPPPLPVYEQPMMPAAGYIWTPGYWAYEPAYGYYWVPGTWIRPPYSGALWTPGYWGWRENVYVFNRGYWGRHVGYYGGINYGYGYGGRGYEGGYWRSNRFYYNRAANNININIHITNVYNRPMARREVTRVSFNGPGGVNVRATSIELRYQHERHTPPVADQIRHRDAAKNDRSLRASENKGNPPIAATERPGVIAKPQGGQSGDGKGGNDRGANNDRNNNNDRGANDKGAAISGKLDNGNASASGNADNKLVNGHLGPASSAASDRQDKAAKLRTQAGVGAAASGAGDASASADADNGAASKAANRVKHTPRAASGNPSGSTGRDNGNDAMSPMNSGRGDNGEQPTRQRMKQPRGNAQPQGSQPQDGQAPMRSPRADRGQGNGMQGQGQPRNERQNQPRDGRGQQQGDGKGERQDRKPRDKDKNENSSGG